MRTLGIIPARYESSRFQGKPLAEIDGKSMLQRVYERAASATILDELLIATDDERILTHALSFGAKAIMTSKHCNNGTERCAEAIAVTGIETDIVINVQGDEPLLNPEQLEQLVKILRTPGHEIATLAYPLSEAEKDNPNIVKVAFDKQSTALAFSRDYLFIRHAAEHIYKHIGLYGFRSEVLKRIVQLKPSPNELLEKLEQLRWLDHGYRIAIGITPFPNLSVDVPDDLNKILEVLKDSLHKT
ncbi:MAG: 3-deoxy-manno-octulosonate cytidylyltransferase [Bacteroidetes bacterium]|nr:3-deoxy-manno-octulosonate cytidylyltransferase [Bacteroidota bacterium]